MRAGKEFLMFHAQILTILFIVVIAGALLTQFGAPALSRMQPIRIRKTISRWTKALALDQMGGYVHDTAMSMIIPLSAISTTVGTWTMVAASNVWSLNHTTADNTSILHIPIAHPLQNGVAQKGAYLKSIDFFYFCGTGDADAITPVIQKISQAAQAGAVPSASAVAFTYDTDHDSAAKRVAHATTMHKMKLTITTPPWMDDDDYYYVEYTMDSSATSVDKLYGVRANYTLRI
jgi:hypothetical protein